MIVEIVGIVGSGKSSVARELRQQYPHVQQGWSILRPRYFLRVIRAMLRSVVTARWYRYSGFERPWYVLKLIWHLDVQLDVLTKARYGGRQTVVFEEGPIFKLCWISVCVREAQICGPAFARWFAHTLQRCGDLVDRVVWLDAPDEVLLARVRNRPHLTGYGIRYKPDREALRLLRLYRTTYEHILSALRVSRDLEITEFWTSEQTPGEICAAIPDIGRMQTAPVTGVTRGLATPEV